eukprot:3028037-Amphidinium_carterae.1
MGQHRPERAGGAEAGGAQGAQQTVSNDRKNGHLTIIPRGPDLRRKIESAHIKAQLMGLQCVPGKRISSQTQPSMCIAQLPSIFAQAQNPLDTTRLKTSPQRFEVRKCLLCEYA